MLHLQYLICTNKYISSAGSVGIGTTTPDASSLLEIKSTKKGLLIPRMTKNQRDAIATSATGLLIYQTNSTPGFYYYNGSAWKPVASSGSTSGGWSLTGNSGTNPSTNFIGTTDAHPLVIKVNNIKAGWVDYTGNNNASFGYQTILSNTTGANNAAFGFGALKSNISGGSNTAFGASALFNNGIGANVSLDEGTRNTAIGASSMYSNTTGLYNTALGTSSLYANTSGYFNTAIGLAALESNIDGHDNTATGLLALDANKGGSLNTATGSRALQANTTGNNNVANGVSALYYNTTGYSNVAIGTEALFTNTDAIHNVAIGDSALFSNNGSENTANGAYALLYNTTGFSNTAIGNKAIFSNTTGSLNTAIGRGALQQNTTGGLNTAIGAGALLNNQTGSYNTALGYGSGDNVGSYSNSSAFGYAATISASYQVRIGSTTQGNNDPTSIGGKVDWSTLSDGRVKKNIKENVPGLIFINKLKPITYNLDNVAINEILQPPAIKDKNGNNIKPSADELSAGKANAAIIYTGFVAQDVEKVARSLNYDFSGVDAAKNDKDLYGLRYAEFVVPLAKAVQELSKMNDAKDSAINAMKDNYDTKINTLQNQINELKAMIVSNQTKVNDEQSAVISSASLQQNIPNPFTHSTTINYALPSKFATAQIVITDKSGKTLKAINISGSKGNVKVDASTLASGAYQYSLIVDGKLIDTKQMMITRE